MRILVIRFRQIGDSILAAPICSSLKKSFPDSTIDYVVYEHIAPLFKHHKYIDNVLTITNEERKNIFKYLKKVRKIRKNKYDIIIDIMATPKTELFTICSSAKYRIGRHKSYRGFTYTHKIKEREADNKVAKFLYMLEPLEKEYDIKYTRDFEIDIDKKDILELRKRMKNAGVDFKKPIFAFAINSRVPSKIYDIDKMCEVIKRVINKYDPQIIFFYSPTEKDFALKTYEKLEKDSHIFTNIHTKSIYELGALLKNVDCFIGNEGGPRHLAQAVNTPTYTILRHGFDIKEWIIESPYNETVWAWDNPKYKKDIDLESEKELVTPELVFNKFTKFYDDKIMAKYLERINNEK